MAAATRVARRVITTAHGALVAPLALVCLIAETLCRPVPACRRLAARVATGIATTFAQQEFRLRHGTRPDTAGHPRTPAERRRYLYAQCGQSALLVAVTGLVAVGLVLAVTLAVGVLHGRVPAWQLLSNTVLGLILLFLAVQGIQSLVAADTTRAAEFFKQSERERLQGQIEDLNRTREAILGAVDAERRRIERDLHDGLQQRLVAVGLMLAQASRTPQGAEQLLGAASDQVDTARRELREVAWSIYPASLHQVGLEEALLTLAQHSAIPATVRYQAPPLSPELEVCLYFTAAELITNGNKHSEAHLIDLRVDTLSDRIRLVVTDDGVGGANADGHGLAGIRGRVEARGGTLGLRSPVGGPTVATVELPCG